jgi:hypothetical protein
MVPGADLSDGVTMITQKTSKEQQTETQPECAHPACSCASEKGSKYCGHIVMVPGIRSSFPATAGMLIAGPCSINRKRFVTCQSKRLKSAFPSCSAVLQLMSRAAVQ